jgi:glutathione peroxidase
MTDSVYEFSPKDIQGSEKSLGEYKGKVLLIVNVASRCGFTPQYTGLEALFEKLKDKGLVVLGFPCNQFGHQEPGDEASIQAFCDTSYAVKFPLFAKVEVNGERAAPLYQFLKSSKPGLLGIEAIKWNFTKFLVDRTGHVVKRYEPSVSPADIETDLEQYLSSE